jgi:hypothetical protein
MPSSFLELGADLLAKLLQNVMVVFLVPEPVQLTATFLVTSGSWPRLFLAPLSLGA